jgi:radical SAM superfamily enzyme YgiQ (UPF0313 family)
LRAPGDILLVSAYTLGHEPLAVAWAAAFLRERGFAPSALDLAVERLDAERVRRAKLIAYHVPMHTALRIALAAHARARALNPTARVCFFGHYAYLHRELLGRLGADFALGGEVESELVRIAEALARGEGPMAPEAPLLEKLRFPHPDRTGLPALSRYVKLAQGSKRRVVGTLEASRGCKHRCLHCPLTPVYDGRFFVVPQGVVLADADTLVAQGATHITFGDPDFLNGPVHALRVARALHARHPHLTFDFTAKVEHLLRHASLLPEWRALGCAFVVSAFESLSDVVLAKLAKGHTRADVFRVVRLAREAGLPLRPSFLPFTPWSRLVDVAELFAFAEAEGLVDLIDPVQFTIRLLVPRGSALLASEGGWFTETEDDPLCLEWRHPDPRMDALQKQMAAIAEEAARSGEDPRDTFDRLRAVVFGALGRPVHRSRLVLPEERPPRLTEPWFC